MAQPSLPDYRERWSDYVGSFLPLLRSKDPFSKPVSMVLRVLWLAAVWGIVLYLRQLAQSAVSAPPPPPPFKNAKAILGRWEPEKGGRTFEFFGGWFRIEGRLYRIEGGCRFLNESEMELFDYEYEDLRHETVVRVGGPIRCLIRITDGDLVISRAPPQEGNGNGWFLWSSDKRPLRLHRVEQE
jgi:hypothetical protein